MTLHVSIVLPGFEYVDTRKGASMKRRDDLKREFLYLQSED